MSTGTQKSVNLQIRICLSWRKTLESVTRKYQVWKKVVRFQETCENRPPKTVNFKDVSPDVIKESEANCDELRDELEDLEHDPCAVLQELNTMNIDSTDSSDSQIIMPTQVTPVSRRKRIRRKRKAENEPVNYSNDLWSENCFQFNGISLREEALDQRDFLKSTPPWNVLNDSLQIDEDHDDVHNDYDEEDLSQSILVKSRRKTSSLSEATHAFASDSNSTVIETSFDSQSHHQIKTESMLLNEVINLEEAISNSDGKLSIARTVQCGGQVCHFLD